MMKYVVKKKLQKYCLILVGQKSEHAIVFFNQKEKKKGGEKS